ncbi:MAG: putative Ig domain-containing protein [Acidobacteria bacterium]|nr:putative Ig domain-containing protein [Acidobacteriota bacterium]
MGCTTPSFAAAPTSPEAVGADAHYVGVGYINGDSHLDIVTTDNDTASLTILLGDGTGNFTVTPSTPFPVGTNPVTVEIGDFNHDNKSDLVVTNEGSNSLSVLLGDGTGNFINAPGSPIAVGAFPRSVAIGNFNGDANSDLVVTNGGSDTLSILLGNGDGTFTPSLGSPVTSAGAPFHAIIGQFNADAFFDLAVANLGAGTMTIFLGNGSGSFTQFGSAIPVGTLTAFLAQGDFNGDSKTDLAAVNRISENLVVFLGDGNGGFTQAPGSPYPVGIAPMAVAAGDLNLDGILDLAVANETGGTTSIFLGNGNGTFNLSTLVTKGQLPTHMALADFNEDGKLDIATSDAGDNTVTILLNTCSACTVINVNPATIPTATVGTSYTESFSGSGGAAPYGLALTGTLPTGLSFNDPTLSGTPTQFGSFPITVTATDFNGCAGSRNYTLVVNCQTITVDPATIPSGTAGTAYASQTFTHTGGIGTTTFSLTGALPTGLTFSGATLSGTPTQTGSFPITVTATDSNGCTGSRNYTLVINCQTITVNPTTIPAGTANTAYSQPFTHTGGIGTTTFAVTGTLPTGLTFSGATLSGTPTQTGSFPITVTATDSNGCTGNRGYTLVINCQTITVNPATIPAGTVSAAYSQTFTHVGGIGTTTFSLTGTLPTGLTFSGDTLSGTPTQTGSFPITVTATDANGCTGSRNYTLVINCQTITINPTTIPAGTANAAYSQNFTHTGGIGTTTFALTGTLPTGVGFSGATLSGTPTQTGSFPITVTATDANGCTGSRNYTLVINCQTITVNPATISSGTANSVYSQSFTQTGGIGTTTFALTGTLPTGLTFSGATLSGTPTQTGSFPITVTATDSNGCAGSRNYTLVINCQTITVNPPTIPSGTASSAYSQTFTHTGGIGTTTFSLTGTLPTGLSLTGATLSGTPTQTGSFPITVTATDSNGCTGSRVYTLDINCQTISVTPTTIPAGTAGTVYSQTFSHSGGIGTVSFGQFGKLPAGITFTGATLSGTPTQTGSFPITITATDANGCTGSRNYTLVINCQSINVNPTTIPSGTVGVAYSQSFTQTGGIGATSFSLTGALPTGITFSGATLSGTPTQSGSFPITVTATDANGCTGSRDYTLLINCQSLTVNPATIPTGTVSTAYSQTFTQTGGVGTVSFALTGTLPTGLTFSGATLSGTPTQSGNFPITVTATDSNNCTGGRSYTLVINCQTIFILPATIPSGTAGTAYSQTFTSSNGIGTVTFDQSGKLPAGITFTGATLSGTPTQTGTYPISITATDANNCSSTRNYTLVINCQSITVNPATIPAGTAGTAYSQTFTQVGGIGTTTFNLTGTLPNGVTFSGATLSGTPTQSGSFPVTVTATDSNGCTGSRGFTLVINCQTITVNPATILAGTASTPYSQTFTQSGGIGTTTFSLTGTLPAGLTFTGATLSGTTSQTGTFPITVIATDSNGCTGSRNYTLVINCQGFTVNPATIPAGTLGTAYFQTFTHTGGIGAVTFNLTGTLPTGLTFSGATLSGTPTQTGSFPITVTATDSNSCVSSRNYTLVINCQTITVTPATIPAGTAGTGYSQTFTQSGGIGTTALSLTGTLPTGLTFSAGALSGTPTQTGSFPITVIATDSNGCTGSRNYTLVINCQTIAVNPATIPAGTAGTAYSQTFTQVGGIGTTTFSLTGTLPTGITFSGAALSGTPTQTGNFPIVVKATDANGCMGTRNYTLVINCPASITVNPAILPNGFVGVSYGSQVLSATGGIAPYTFTVSAGALPGGITLSGASLSGTPTTGGTFNFTIQAADSNGCIGTRAYTVIISGGAKGAGLQFYPLPAPVRLLDTRSGETGCFTPGAQIPGNTSRTQSAAGACSIPATAQAVTGNITTVQSGGGFLTLYPSDAAQPTVSNSNYLPNQIVNNVFTVGLGASDGAFKIFVNTSADVVVDITGYYAPPGTGGLYFHPLPKPIRLLETRTGETGCFAPGTPLPGGVDTVQQGTTTCSGVTIPSTALALFGNATTVNPVLAGYLNFFPANATRPLVANGNFVAGQILNSPFTVGLSPTGQFKIFTTAQTDLVIDVHGYYSAEAVDVNGQGLLFSPLPTPVRLLDTRNGFTGCFTPGAPLQAAVEQSQLAGGTCTIGSSAQAIVGNATVVNDPVAGFLTLWPSNAVRPFVSSSNWVANQVFNRYFTVGLGSDGKFKMYASAGTDLVIDVSGYFAP